MDNRLILMNVINGPMTDYSLAGNKPLSDRHSGQLVQSVLHNGTPGARLAGSGSRDLPTGTRGAPNSAGGTAENTTFRQIRGEFRSDADDYIYISIYVYVSNEVNLTRFYLRLLCVYWFNKSFLRSNVSFRGMSLCIYISN